MKAVLQRVLSASVAGTSALDPSRDGLRADLDIVDGKTISSIGKGLLVLVGIDRRGCASTGQTQRGGLSTDALRIDDTPHDSSVMIKKLLSAKLFDEEGKNWKKSVKEIEGEVLCGMSNCPLLSSYLRIGFMRQQSG